MLHLIGQTAINVLSQPYQAISFGFVCFGENIYFDYMNSDPDND